MVDIKSIQNIIKEELTKNEIVNIVSSQMDNELNSHDFNNKVKKIAADVVEELFKTLWQKRTFWKNEIKK